MSPIAPGCSHSEHVCACRRMYNVDPTIDTVIACNDDMALAWRAAEPLLEGVQSARSGGLTDSALAVPKSRCASLMATGCWFSAHPAMLCPPSARLACTRQSEPRQPPTENARVSGTTKRVRARHSRSLERFRSSSAPRG